MKCLNDVHVIDQDQRVHVPIYFVINKFSKLNKSKLFFLIRCPHEQDKNVCHCLLKQLQITLTKVFSSDTTMVKRDICNFEKMLVNNDTCGH